MVGCANQSDRRCTQPFQMLWRYCTVATWQTRNTTTDIPRTQWDKNNTIRYGSDTTNTDSTEIGGHSILRCLHCTWQNDENYGKPNMEESDTIHDGLPAHTHDTMQSRGYLLILLHPSNSLPPPSYMAVWPVSWTNPPTVNSNHPKQDGLSPYPPTKYGLCPTEHGWSWSLSA